MMKKNGTGPKGHGPDTGRGGRGRGRRSGGQGQGGGFAAGTGGYCVCPNCGEKAPHQMGSPCYEQKCPKCGKDMTRQ
ncbi:hypothetical protein DRN98_06130 [Methanosarcinales archaeon]|nr:MAG: hypothetical protein DRN98_06130 [Methanosarcinales archaeon]